MPYNSLSTYTICTPERLLLHCIPYYLLLPTLHTEDGVLKIWTLPILLHQRGNTEKPWTNQDTHTHTLISPWSKLNLNPVTFSSSGGVKWRTLLHIQEILDSFPRIHFSFETHRNTCLRYPASASKGNLACQDPKRKLGRRESARRQPIASLSLVLKQANPKQCKI